MARIGMTPDNLFQVALVQLIREHGQANAEWTDAYIDVPDDGLLEIETTSLCVQRNMQSRTWRISVALEQPKEDQPVETKKKKEEHHQFRDVCKNCDDPIFKDRSTSSVWYHVFGGNTNCSRGNSGKWAQPRNIPAFDRKKF